jgi:hypothetical protein
MSASWHFTTDDKGLIQLQARFKGPDGTTLTMRLSRVRTSATSPMTN